MSKINFVYTLKTMLIITAQSPTGAQGQQN